jgi:glycosyltransferase involved in cell wall biosynthesis
MNTPKSSFRVGYIMRSYPRLSQTFVVNEIRALEQLGVQIHIFAVTHPHESLVQPQVAEVQAPVDYLEAAQKRHWWFILWEQLLALLLSPYRYFNTLYYLLFHPEFDEGYTASSRYDCFLQAVYLVRLLRRERRASGGIDHLHAHFAHDPTLIAQLVHLLTGIPYTFTAHARDIYQIPKTALAERIKYAGAVITCCATNVDYLKTAAPPAQHGKLRVIHNGINLHEFQPAARNGKSSTAPLILSASRLAEKKGFPDLLRACQRLKQEGRQFRCVIYGDGPLRGDLAALVSDLGLMDDVTLAGACTQQELRQALPLADIFALTPFVTEDGDRDGVPTVLAEAMACGVPVVSTTVAGIPELVRHECNGLLAAPHDIETVAAGLAALLRNETWRRKLGAAARDTVARDFDLRAGALQLANLFQTVGDGGQS